MRRSHSVASALLLASLVCVAAPAPADVEPVGPELQVNTYTTGSQLEPHVSADASGAFVVVWDNERGYPSGPDGSSSGVSARRFDGAGTPDGPEFVVNTYTIGPQYLPSVAAAPGGDFLVAWAGGNFVNPQDGSASGVFVQRFAGNGARVGPEFRANTTVAGFQTSPAVAVAPSGASMVVWQSFNFLSPAGADGSGSGVFGQRYDVAGSLLGGEFRVNTFTPGDQIRPRVAAEPDGGFVVVWESQGYQLPEDGDGAGIFAQRYDASGAPQGGEFQVNSFTPGSQVDPAIASDPTGGFVVVWESLNAPTGDRDDNGVFGQRFDAGATRVGEEFQVNSYTTGQQRSPEVATDGDGNFVVVWESSGYVAAQDGSFAGIFGQHFFATGAPLGPEFQVNTYTTGAQFSPSITADPDGDFVVVWSSGYYGVSQDGDGSGIFAQRFRTSGFEPARPAAGRKLALRDDPSNPLKRKLSLRADDETIQIGAGAGSRDDPTSHGGSLRVTSAGVVHTYPLPAGGWRGLGPPGSERGYRYRDGSMASGPISEVVVRPGALHVVGKGAALAPLPAVNPDPVVVTFQLGSSGVRECLVFGGATAFHPGKGYRASNAPAVASCGR
jgi:hypothetical protein